MPEVTKRTIFGAVIQVGVMQRPKQVDGEPLVNGDGAPDLERIKVLIVTDPETLTETTIWVEPGDEDGIADALATEPASKIVRATLDDLPRHQG